MAGLFRRVARSSLEFLGLKNTTFYWVLRNRRYVREVFSRLAGVYPRQCPLCGYVGRFGAVGMPPRLDAQCPECGAAERHRLFAVMDRAHDLLGTTRSILHFAPEPAIGKYIRQRVQKYTSADLYKSGVDRKENIESISLPDNSVDAVFCSHVLEHVDDRKAQSELHRILRPGGILIVMVPICEGWDTTYEDPEIAGAKERELNFGLSDHVRYYGRDFAERLASHGFRVRSFAADPSDVAKYGLGRGEKVFVAMKNSDDGRQAGRSVSDHPMG